MAKEQSGYKDTLNLPKTSFDMRAGLVRKEPEIQAAWRRDKIYERIRAARAGCPRFILHDGPPYANGNIHMGTALNKVLKDMVVRLKTMSGYDAPYVPGWDCHGLPIEQKVLDELGATAATMEAMDIRRRCSAYADHFASVQSEQFQRLGVAGEFDEPYITMHPKYEAAVLEVFARLVEKGIVYRQLKPVHWSIENQTALADAELEYYDREDISIYAALPVAEANTEDIPHAEGDKVALLIWTTTPWTLPANLAVAVDPAFEYAAVHADTADGPVTYVIAAELIERVINVVNSAREGWISHYETLETFPGKALLDAGVSYRHPLFAGKLCPVVPADYVTLEEGTGLVHTAPGHGLEDYGTGLKYGLEVYCPVQADGTFDQTAPDWLVGVSVWDANAKVTDYLRQAGLLLLGEKITHSYPHDWRSKTPTVFRATKQWFIAVDRPLAGQSDSLRDLAMAACRRGAGEGGINFIPSWGRSRITGMLESRPDWCISRQRAWGLPIPVFFNEDDQALLTPASVRAVATCVGEKGSDVWFTGTPEEILSGYDPAEDADVDDPKAFALDKLTCGKDIFDVWFESGSSWFAAAIERRLVSNIPVELYLEGSDQHRGWFQLSLLPALAAGRRAPFKAVLTHGVVVTEEGYKMSKSLGNDIPVIEQLDRRGADILRLWVASQNYQDDVRCSERLIAQAEDAYRKIRNTLRFAMGACADFDPRRHSAAPEARSIDRWMKMRLHELICEARSAYDAYEFHRAARLIYEFCTVEASSIYMSAAKDRLYCEAPDSPRRRATQTVTHEMLLALVKLLAPILPHTAEEAWQHIPFRDPAEPQSVHLAKLPECDEEVLRMAKDLRPVDLDAADAPPGRLEAGPGWTWRRLLDVRSEALLKLEALRNAGVKNPLDAEVVLTVPANRPVLRRFLEQYLGELEDMLGVGYARIADGPELPDDQTTGLDAVGIEALDAREKYGRCARSWKRRPDVGSDGEYPELSARDAAVMRQRAGK
ncbi:MAG: isoleucine--tRNA ligase [Planctomycetota bacterium]|jgi:isoleucyl-tRNA synthetase